MINRINKYASILLIIILLSQCKLFVGSNGDKIINAYLDTFRQVMLDEVNYARTDPVGYAEERLKSYYDSGTDNGAYSDLISRSPVSTLKLNDALNNASTKYATFLADNNLWGHYEDGSPNDRCTAEGYGPCGENIAANSASSYNAVSVPNNAAREFVIMWIIDEGVPSLGHRLNILNTSYKHLGVGFHRNLSSTYYNYAVQNFGSI